MGNNQNSLINADEAAVDQDSIIPKRLRLRCGAKCRDGHACRAPAVWDYTRNRPKNGRCRMHGGLSTGPKTPEGKRRSFLKLKQYR